MRLKIATDHATRTLPLSAFFNYSKLHILHLSALQFSNTLHSGFKMNDLPPRVQAINLQAIPHDDEKALRQSEVKHLEWTRMTCLLSGSVQVSQITFEYGDGGKLWPVHGWMTGWRELHEDFPNDDSIQITRGQILKQFVFRGQRSIERSGLAGIVQLGSVTTDMSCEEHVERARCKKEAARKRLQELR